MQSSLWRLHRESAALSLLHDDPFSPCRHACGFVLILSGLATMTRAKAREAAMDRKREAASSRSLQELGRLDGGQPEDHRDTEVAEGGGLGGGGARGVTLAHEGEREGTRGGLGGSGERDVAFTQNGDWEGARAGENGGGRDGGVDLG